MGAATFDVRRDVGGRVRAQVWDRICVPSGVDVKDGQETEFSLETLGQMLDNFVDRGDCIPLDWNHQGQMVHLNGQPAPALAWYSALAIVWGGKLVRCESVGDVTPTYGEDGLDVSRDGLYGFRSEVTDGSGEYPLGQQLLPGFRYVSPTFTSDGSKRDGTPCGYALLAVAATNTPFQEQTTLTMSGAATPVLMRIEQRGDKWVVLPETGDKVLGTHDTKADAEKQLAAIEASKAAAHKQETQMAAGLATCPECKQKESVNSSGNFVGHTNKQGQNCPGSGKPAGAVGYDNTNEGAKSMALSKYAKFAGAADDADDSAIKQAIGAKMAGLAQKAMSEDDFDLGEAAKEMDDAAALMEGDAEMAAEYQMARKMSARFSKMAKFDAADGDGDEDEKKKFAAEEEEKSKMAKLEADKDSKAAMAVMQASLNATNEKLAKFEAAEAKRAEAEKKELEAKFSRLADQAIAGGYDKAQRDNLITFARSNYEAAHAAVAHLLPKTNAPAHLFDRASRNGAPIGGDTHAREDAGAIKPRVVTNALGRFVEVDSQFATEIEKVADSKDPVTMAKVDKLLPAPQRTIKFHRLLAARKVVAAERPDLADAAEAAE